MKNQHINYLQPPKKYEFHDLFKYIWMHGIGNYFNRTGEPTPWTDVALENRFAELGYSIDKRTIQHWRTGNYRPNLKNIHALAKVVAADESGRKQIWANALIESLAIKAEVIAIASKQASKWHGGEPSKNIGSVKRLQWPSISIFFGLLLLLTLLIWVYSQKKSAIIVTDLKFCDEKRFSRELKICITNVSHYPEGTKLIFTCFKLTGASEGQPFERRWYREGQEFIRKDGFYDNAWEDFTWLLDENSLEVGRYDLRIVINKKATTGTFYVGEVNESHEWP